MRDCVCEGADAREMVCVREQARAGVCARAGGSCCVCESRHELAAAQGKACVYYMLCVRGSKLHLKECSLLYAACAREQGRTAAGAVCALYAVCAREDYKGIGDLS